MSLIHPYKHSRQDYDTMMMMTVVKVYRLQASFYPKGFHMLSVIVEGCPLSRVPLYVIVREKDDLDYKVNQELTHTQGAANSPSPTRMHS